MIAGIARFIDTHRKARAMIEYINWHQKVNALLRAAYNIKTDDVWQADWRFDWHAEWASGCTPNEAMQDAIAELRDRGILDEVQASASIECECSDNVDQEWTSATASHGSFKPCVYCELRETQQQRDALLAACEANIRTLQSIAQAVRAHHADLVSIDRTLDKILDLTDLTYEAEAAVAKARAE